MLLMMELGLGLERKVQKESAPGGGGYYRWGGEHTQC